MKPKLPTLATLSGGIISCDVLNWVFFCVFLDVDECLLNIHDCSPNANCNNNLGSYNCKCHNGYSGDGTVCDKGGYILIRAVIGSCRK